MEKVFDEDDGETFDQNDEEFVDNEGPEEPVNVFGSEEPDDEDVVVEDREVIAGYRGLVEQDARILDEYREAGDDWIFDAFEHWRLNAVDHDAVHEEIDPDALDQGEAGEADLVDVFDEDTDDRLRFLEPQYAEEEIPDALRGMFGENSEPHDSASSASQPELSVISGRKKARHKKQSRRQRRRSTTKAQRHAKKAAAESAKESELPDHDQADLAVSVSAPSA